MARSIAAFTEPTGSYPPYFSIVDDDGDVAIFVRSAPRRDENRLLVEGSHATIRLPRSIAVEQLKQAVDALEGR